MKVNKDQFNYWQLRDLQAEQENQDEATDKLKIINSAYQQAQTYLSDEVKKIYRRYFYADISTDEIESIMSSHISPSELVTLKALASDITDKESKKAVDDYLSRLAAKSRITRLEEMQVKAYIAAKSAGAVELEQNVKLHTDVMKRAWAQAEKQGAVYDKAKDYKLDASNAKPVLEQRKDKIVIKDPKTGKEVASVSMKVDESKTKFTKMPNKYVERALNSRWNGSNFSSRIWDNTDKLADRLKELFTVKELSNMPEREMIKQIDQEFNVGKFNASRLIRTEVNYFYSKTKLDNWKRRGIKQYQLIAILDSRTSKICRSINKKIFNVSDAVFGKNMPPLHPFCRTVAVIYLGAKRLKNVTGPEFKFRDIPTHLEKDKFKKSDIEKIYKRLKFVFESYQKETGIDIQKEMQNPTFIDKDNPYNDEKSKFVRYLLEKTGYTDYPRKVETVEKSDRFYRGVRDTPTKSAQEFLDQINTGDMPISGAGNSSKGRGLYISDLEFIARMHVNKGASGKIVIWGLDKKSRILDFDNCYMPVAYHEINLSVPDAVKTTESNLDILALVCGYDIIRWKSTINVLNRGKMLWPKYIK